MKFRDVCKCLLLVLFFLTLLRCGFISYAHSGNVSLDNGLFFRTLLWGLRYDLATVLILNLPFILLHQVLWRNLLKSYYVLINGGLLFLNIVDIPLYTFTNKRMTGDFIYFIQDAWQQSWHLLSDFSFIPLLGGLLFFLLLKGSSLFFEKPSVKDQLLEPYGLSKRFLILDFLHWKQLLKLTVTLAFLVIAIRGGLQSKPLSVVHAHTLKNSFASSAAQNTGFSILQSLYKGGIKKYHFFSSRDEVLKILRPQYCKSDFHGRGKGFNTVVIIVESLAREYMGLGNDYKGYTPFLDELASESLFFSNTVANGQRSIESLPAILASVPHLLNEAFSTTSYMQNRFSSLGQILNHRGYETSFFHGGRNGTMYFDSTAARLGFEKYYGLDEYPKRERDFDGAWGIFDGPFLQFSLKEMSQQREPWASVMFTLSSHHPYKIPKGLQDQFKGGHLKIHKSIEYVDWALRGFFKKASQEPWYKRTLFVITGDHTQKNHEPAYSTRVKRRLVPLYFYLPGQEDLRGAFSQQVQQLDIFPSILDILGVSSRSSLPFSQSVFSECYESRALFFEQGAFWLSDGSDLLRYDDNESNSSQNGRDKDKERLLKASLQYFFNGLIENNW